MDQRMADKETTAEMRKEYEKVKNQADAYSKDELHGVFKKYQIVSPDTKNEVGRSAAQRSASTACSACSACSARTGRSSCRHAAHTAARCVPTHPLLYRACS